MPGWRRGGTQLCDTISGIGGITPVRLLLFFGGGGLPPFTPAFRPGRAGGDAAGGSIWGGGHDTPMGLVAVGVVIAPQNRSFSAAEVGTGGVRGGVLTQGKMRAILGDGVAVPAEIHRRGRRGRRTPKKNPQPTRKPKKPHNFCLKRRNFLVPTSAGEVGYGEGGDTHTRPPGPPRCPMAGFGSTPRFAPAALVGDAVGLGVMLGGGILGGCIGERHWGWGWPQRVFGGGHGDTVAQPLFPPPPVGVYSHAVTRVVPPPVSPPIHGVQCDTPKPIWTQGLGLGGVTPPFTVSGHVLSVPPAQGPSVSPPAWHRGGLLSSPPPPGWFWGCRRWVRVQNVPPLPPPARSPFYRRAKGLPVTPPPPKKNTSRRRRWSPGGVLWHRHPVVLLSPPKKVWLLWGGGTQAGWGDPGKVGVRVGV